MTNGIDSKTSYERWMAQEGVPVTEGYGFDVKEIPLGAWPRRGGRGAFVQLRGMEGATGMEVVEIPPGKALCARKNAGSYSKIEPAAVRRSVPTRSSLR